METGDWRLEARACVRDLHRVRSAVGEARGLAYAGAALSLRAATFDPDRNSPCEREIRDDSHD
jgi:hypothetical protein